MQPQTISQEGYEKLKIELNFLIEKRKEIAERIQRAKDQGDLSENAEYSEAKDAQAFNEGRIAELIQMQKNLTVVQNGNNRNIVGMNSKIKVQCNGKEKEFIIVSFNESDPLNGKISNESPLGKAFLNQKVGITVQVETPKGIATYKILEIK